MEILSRDMVVGVKLDSGSEVRTPGVPMKFSGSRAVKDTSL